jgi:hypothetical protein
MDARQFINLLEYDHDRRRREEWDALHKRPDASPLAPEEAIPWVERVPLLRWLSSASRIARRVPVASGRGRRREGGQIGVDGVG